MISKVLGDGEAVGGGADVSEVFSTYVYEGNDSPKSISNNIDLSDGQGMVWLKARNVTQSHALFDTDRGVNKRLISNDTGGETTTANTLTSFNSDGFTVGTVYSQTPYTYSSWTFKKAPRFFDQVTYTGNGVAGREIAHELGCEVGMMIVKKLNNNDQWAVYHKSEGATRYGYLSLTNAFATSSTYWNDTPPTDNVFTVGTEGKINNNGDEYIAYLFAHDPLGVSGDGSDGMIACGSYVGNTSTFPSISLGWETQYVLIKNADGVSDWSIFDTIRGTTVDSDDPYLEANTSDSEGSFGFIKPTQVGFNIKASHSRVNTNGQTYIYMAIRRPMTTPLTSDEVFAIDTRGSSGDGLEPGFRTSFPVDFVITKETQGSNTLASCRLTQGKELRINQTNGENTNTRNVFDYMNGFYDLGSEFSNHHAWMWKRAKGFFDVVAYTGNGIAGRTVNHNLGVVPEMMWVKLRDASNDWYVYTTPTGNGKYLSLNDSDGATAHTGYWNLTTPTDAVFTVGSTYGINNSGGKFIAYLFATLAGISKVGSYTGNGTNQVIDCGFTTGAKFIIIKKTSGTGSWIMFDAVRGITTGIDPLLMLDNTVAEQDAYDCVDPDTSGFVVNEEAYQLNTNGSDYIFYAIAN